jgi:hypothetical protein
MSWPWRVACRNAKPSPKAVRGHKGAKILGIRAFLPEDRHKSSTKMPQKVL